MKLLNAYFSRLTRDSIREIYPKSIADLIVLLCEQPHGEKNGTNRKEVIDEKLKKCVDEKGGTAWVQTRVSGKIMYLWHPSSSFEPLHYRIPYSHKFSVVTILRSSRDGWQIK